KSVAVSQALLVHLGMTGNLAPHFAGQPLDKHTHVTFVLDDGRELRYTDARRFGRMAYLAGETLAAELLKFGPDPLEVAAEVFSMRPGDQEDHRCGQEQPLLSRMPASAAPNEGRAKKNETQSACSDVEEVDVPTPAFWRE